MARRGFCRCGTLLRFKRTARGYKTRCPSCKAIVRLRTDAPPPPPTLADFDAPAPPAVLAETAPVDLSVLSTHDSNAPVALVEMEAYHPPPPPPEPGRAGWWLLALAAGAAVLAALTAAVFLS